jgi:hypothetical protein
MQGSCGDVRSRWKRAREPTVSTGCVATRTIISLASKCRALKERPYYPNHIHYLREMEPHDAPTRHEICNSQPKTALTANSLSARTVILCECLIISSILLTRIRWCVCPHFLLTYLSRLKKIMPLSARLHTWFQLDGAWSDDSRRVRHCMWSSNTVACTLTWLEDSRPLSLAIVNYELCAINGDAREELWRQFQQLAN